MVFSNISVLRKTPQQSGLKYSKCDLPRDGRLARGRSLYARCKATSTTPSSGCLLRPLLGHYARAGSCNSGGELAERFEGKFWPGANTSRCRGLTKAPCRFRSSMWGNLLFRASCGAIGAPWSRRIAAASFFSGGGQDDREVESLYNPLSTKCFDWRMTRANRAGLAHTALRMESNGCSMDLLTLPL